MTLLIKVTNYSRTWQFNIDCIYRPWILHSPQGVWNFVTRHNLSYACYRRWLQCMVHSEARHQELFNVPLPKWHQFPTKIPTLMMHNVVRICSTLFTACKCHQWKPLETNKWFIFSLSITLTWLPSSLSTLNGLFSQCHSGVNAAVFYTSYYW